MAAIINSAAQKIRRFLGVSYLAAGTLLSPGSIFHSDFLTAARFSKIGKTFQFASLYKTPTRNAFTSFPFLTKIVQIAIFKIASPSCYPDSILSKVEYILILEPRAAYFGILEKRSSKLKINRTSLKFKLIGKWLNAL